MDKPETWASSSGIDRVHDPVFEDGRLIGFAFDTNIGGKTYAGVAKPHSRIEGESISWQIQNAEITGQVRVDISPIDTQTRIRVELDVESKGMMSRMFFPLIAGVIGNGLPQTVDAFASGFEGT